MLERSLTSLAPVSQPSRFAFLPVRRDDVIAQPASAANGDRATRRWRVYDQRPASAAEPVLLMRTMPMPAVEAGGAKCHRVHATFPSAAW